MVAGAFVVPGAQFFAGEDAAGGKFGGKDAQSVYGAAIKDRQSTDQGMDRPEESGHTIDKEHKDKGISHACFFAASEGLQGCEKDFQTPAQDATAEKGDHKFFHNPEYFRFQEKYSCTADQIRQK